MSRLVAALVLAVAGCGSEAVDAIVPKLLVQVDYPNQSGPVDLTAQGSADWVHFGLENAASVTRKSGGRGLFGALVVIGPAAEEGLGWYANDPLTFQWTDGSPTVVEAGTSTGIFSGRAGGGFELPLSVGPEERTFVVHLGGWMSRGRLEILRGSDRGVLYDEDRQFQAGLGVTTGDEGQYARPVSMTFKAAVETGETQFIVRYTNASDGDGGNVTLTAATARP